MWEEFREMFYWGPKEYFQSWMNIAELFNLLVFFNTAAFRFLAFQEIGVLAESFADDDSFLDMRSFGTYSQVAMNLLACNALMSYCKVFKYLKFHRGITQFVETIYEATFEVRRTTQQGGSHRPPNPTPTPHPILTRLRHF